MASPKSGSLIFTRRLTLKESEPSFYSELSLATDEMRFVVAPVTVRADEQPHTVQLPLAAFAKGERGLSLADLANIRQVWVGGNWTRAGVVVVGTPTIHL